MTDERTYRMVRVSIHAFRGEGDMTDERTYRMVRVSIHAFRGEGDGCSRFVSAFTKSFQSTPSGGKATFVTVINSPYAPVFQSTPSGGKATPLLVLVRGVPKQVSIHAFRGEGDIDRLMRGKAEQWVSIHAFRGEGDLLPTVSVCSAPGFQSTPSGGKATH